MRDEAIRRILGQAEASGAELVRFLRSDMTDRLGVLARGSKPVRGS